MFALFAIDYNDNVDIGEDETIRIGAGWLKCEMLRCYYAIDDYALN